MGSMAQIYPLHILIASLAGLLNQKQAEVLDYLVEENRVLKEQLKGRRLRLNDDQRRRLAAKGQRIGRRLLMQVATIVTPQTILRRTEWATSKSGLRPPQASLQHALDEQTLLGFGKALVQATVAANEFQDGNLDREVLCG